MSISVSEGYRKGIAIGPNKAKIAFLVSLGVGVKTAPLCKAAFLRGYVSFGGVSIAVLEFLEYDTSDHPQRELHRSESRWHNSQKVD